MATIEIQNLTKKFGDTIAVDNVSLKIKGGEFVVFLGPSGCGKTTTLNCIAGLEEPTSGRILFDGSDVTRFPPHERDIAMVFQASTVYPHLNAYKNIEMSLRIREMTKTEKQEKITEVTKMLDIQDLLDKMPHELSGGERQRVATAKAIVRNPSAFLLDEPLSDLDAALRESLRAEINRIQKELGITMIFVTHDQTEAMTMGDKIAVMNKGQLIQIGTPDDIYNKPQNPFVAQFVGSPPINFFEGTLQRENGVLFVQSTKFSIKVDGNVKKIDDNFIGQPILLGIRPQNLEISQERSSKTHFTAEIYAIEPLGKETIVTLQFEGKRLKVISSPSFRGCLGDKVYIAVDERNLYLFDKKSEQNISI